MKNILVVAPYFYPEIGGLENYAFQVAKRLAKKGYSITACALGKNTSEETIEGINVIRKKCHLTVSNTPIRFNLLFDLLKIVKENKIDIIHAHTPVPFAVDVASLASRLKKVPLIVTYHSNNLYRDQVLLDALTALYKVIQAISLSRAKVIVSVVKDFRKSLAGWKNKVRVISPGVNLESFPYTKYPGQNNNILFISPLRKSAPSKGTDIMLKSLITIKKDIPGILLTIAGDGNLTDYYRKMSKDLNLENNVIFAGQVQYHAMPYLYQKSGVLAVPSLKSEGCPTVIMEAFATGRPVVGTTIGGIPDLIDDKINGFLVKPNNSEELAGALIRILQNPGQAENFGKHGRNKVEQLFTWDKITEKYEQILKTI